VPQSSYVRDGSLERLADAPVSPFGQNIDAGVFCNFSR
jgi:hypothetical protein